MVSTIDTIRHGYETLTGSNAKYSRRRVTTDTTAHGLETQWSYEPIAGSDVESPVPRRQSGNDLRENGFLKTDTAGTSNSG